MQVNKPTVANKLVQLCSKNPKGKSCWFTRDVRDLSIFGNPTRWRPFAGLFKVLTYAIARGVQWRLLKMNVFRPSMNVDELCSKVPIISDYCKSLDGNVKRRYLEKVAVIAVDAITIPDEHFSSDCLPLVEATDLLSYLVLGTSFYTKQ